MTTPEIQYQINSLPPTLVEVSERFHIQCQQHLARAQAQGRAGWEFAPKECLLKDLELAVKEGDWTSVSNYAMMLNHKGVVVEQNEEAVQTEEAAKQARSLLRI